MGGCIQGIKPQFLSELFSLPKARWANQDSGMLLLHVWVPTRSQQRGLIVPLKPSRGKRQEVRVGWFSPEMDGLGPFVLLLMGNWLESGWEQVDNLPPPPDTSRLTTEVCRYLNMARRLQDMASWPQEGGSLEKETRELTGRNKVGQAYIHSC